MVRYMLPCLMLALCKGRYVGGGGEWLGAWRGRKKIRKMRKGRDQYE